MICPVTEKRCPLRDCEGGVCVNQHIADMGEQCKQEVPQPSPSVDVSPAPVTPAVPGIDTWARGYNAYIDQHNEPTPRGSWMLACSWMESEIQLAQEDWWPRAKERILGSYECTRQEIVQICEEEQAREQTKQ